MERRYHHHFHHHYHSYHHHLHHRQLLPSSSRKRSRLPSPSLPPLVLPSPLPSSLPPIVAPPPEHIESIGDDIDSLRASLASVMQETMTLRARVRLLEQHDVVTQDSLRIERGRIIRSKLQAEYAEHEIRELREFRDIKASRARAEAAKQQAETLQIVAQRVAYAIETIAIYEAKTRVARDLMNQFERQEDMVAENASNKRKSEGDHGGSSS
uniref:Uncharacterized protein n=1 Tax=Tanacetum cinerariifolium TaxID=118510 RepID=A0A699HIA6_TANCI|nr:hypothetical protein [Tanacetum cinerariifolium]